MVHDRIRRTLDHARDRHYMVKVLAVNPAGNTVEVVGYVTAIQPDGGIRVHSGDPEHGQVHDFPPSSILAVERAHGS